MNYRLRRKDGKLTAEALRAGHVQSWRDLPISVSLIAVTPVGPFSPFRLSVGGVWDTEIEAFTLYPSDAKTAQAQFSRAVRWLKAYRKHNPNIDPSRGYYHVR